MTLSVLMPAHNEQEYLADAVREVLDGLCAGQELLEVLIVENGSRDRTAAVAATLALEHSEVRYISLEQADYGEALAAGLLQARGAWVVVFDVDLVDLSFLRAAQTAANSAGADIVVGSKRGPGAHDRRGVGRRIVTSVFATLLRIGFGLGVSDTHGLKLVRLAAVAQLVERRRFGRDIFDTELILRAERTGLVIVEVPVNVADRRPPRTSIVRRIPGALVGLARLKVAMWREPVG